jgi:hypothetical protein
MPANYRSIRDAGLQANLVAPNANATTLSGVIDLGATNPFPTTEHVVLAVIAPAIANLANTKTITFTVEDADANANANFAALSISGTITGGASGSAATTLRFSLPGTVRRYVRISALGGSAAGTTITETARVEVLT